MRREPIPVVPAAHYCCRVCTDDLSTSVPACWQRERHTGHHGANRLASNSILESLVFAHRVSITLDEQSNASEVADLKIQLGMLGLQRTRTRVLVAHAWDELGASCGTMSASFDPTSASVVQNARRMRETHDYWASSHPTSQLRNIVTVAT